MEQQQMPTALFILIEWGYMIQPHVNAFAETACAATTRGHDIIHHASHCLFGVSVMVSFADFLEEATRRVLVM